MKKILILFFLCITQIVFAETLELNLQSAIGLAYENNSELKRQKLILDAAARTVRKSYNSLIPAMSLSAGDSYSFPGETPANSVNIEGSVSLNLKTSVKSNADKNVISYELEKSNYDIQANIIRQSVCDSYYEILEAQQQLVIKKENLEILQELYEENQYKYRKGFLSEIDYLNSKILYEKSKSDYLALQLEVRNLTNNLKMILGLPVSNEIVFKSDLSQLYNFYSDHFTEKYQAFLLNPDNVSVFPELKALGYQKQLLEKELQIKQLEIWGPDLSISYQVNPIFGAADINGRIKNTINANVSIPLENLIPASQGREELNLTQDQIRDIDIQITSKRQELEITITNLLLLAKQKIETLDTCKVLYEVTSNNLEICKVSYSKGMLDFQSLKNANTEYLDSQLECSNMVLEILKIFSSIEQISGENFKE